MTQKKALHRYLPLFLLSLALSFPGAIHAITPFSCTAAAPVPLTVHRTGVSELVSDVILDCTGGVPTADGVPIPAVNITVFLNGPVTSRKLMGSWSEAVLLLDEPGTGDNLTQAPCQSSNGVCTNYGNGFGRYTGLSSYYVGQGGGSNVNIFQAQQTGGNQLLFAGIPIDPPGDSGHRIIRITNLRVDASSLSSPDPAIPPQVQSLVSASGAISMPVNNPVQILAFALPAADFSLRDANGDAFEEPPVVTHCEGRTNQKIGVLRFSEGYPTAFKLRNAGATTADPSGLSNQNVPGTMYNSESGFFNSALIGNAARGDLGKAGLADAGVRFQAVFSGVPDGVILYVDVNGIEPNGGSGTARLTASDTGAFSAIDPTGGGPARASALGFSGTAVWEVTETNLLDTGALDFAVYATYAAGVNPGIISVAGVIAPTASESGAASTAIPRFNFSSGRKDLFRIIATDCDAPEVTISGKKTQKISRPQILVTGICNETCTLSASATVRAGKKMFSLPAISSSGGASVFQELKWRLSKPVRKAIRNALSLGKRVSAAISVSAQDASGNASSTDYQVRIRR